MKPTVVIWLIGVCAAGFTHGIAHAEQARTGVAKSTITNVPREVARRTEPVSSSSMQIVSSNQSGSSTGPAKAARPINPFPEGSPLVESAVKGN